MVSRQVSSVVDLKTIRQDRRKRSSSPPSGTQKSRPPKRPSPGPHLVRSGNIYLFQVRWPKRLDPERRAAPIRISLGACPHREARRQADLLIGYARHLFGLTELRCVTEEQSKSNEASEDNDEDFQPALGDPIVQAEFIGELRAYHRIISRPPPPDSPADQKIHAAMRGFVGLAKEIADPESANPLIIENFEELRSKYTDDLKAAITEKDSAARTLDPKEETARRARALAERTGISAGFAGTTEKPLPAASLPKAGSASDIKPTSQSAKKAPVANASPTSPVEPTPVQTATPQKTNSPERPHTPVHQYDRRTVERASSTRPLFSYVAEEYLSSWLDRNPEASKDVDSARTRKELFIELIGDHPVDTYTGADLQAFVEFLKFYPANPNARSPALSAREIISANQTFELTPLSKASVQNVYVSNVKSMIRHGMVDYEYKDPFDGVRLRYPSTASNQIETEPLSSDQITRIFRTGVDTGLLDNTMLPLLGHLTGRRLGLLTYLKGTDIWEKFPGIWVAQTSGIYFDENENRWKRVPYKTGASTRYFVLHPFLKEIGYIDWALKQQDWLFPGLMKLADPAKSASQYMGRLFKKAGVKTREDGGREIFHSLRGGHIEDLREQGIDARDRRLQVGHKLTDIHEEYGFKSLTEKAARRLTQASLNKEIDYSMFKGLDFERIAENIRSRGRKRR